MASKKLTITMDEELIEKIDIEAKSNYTNRSSYITMVMARYINQVNGVQINIDNPKVKS